MEPHGLCPGERQEKEISPDDDGLEELFSCAFFASYHGHRCAIDFLEEYKSKTCATIATRDKNFAGQEGFFCIVPRRYCKCVSLEDCTDFAFLRTDGFTEKAAETPLSAKGLIQLWDTYAFSMASLPPEKEKENSQKTS